MTLAQIKVFITVYESQNESKAADLLFVSQPAVSQAIKSLEKEFEKALFVRIHNKLVPTEDADKLYAMSMKLLNYVDEITHEMKTGEAEQTLIKVGLPPVSAAYFIPKIARLKETYANSIIINMIEYPTNEGLAQLLDEGAIDIAFSTLDSRSYPNLEKAKLADSHFLLCVSSKHHLSSEKSVSIFQFKDEPLIRTFRNNSVVHRAIERYYDKHGLRPNYQYYITQQQAAEELIRSGYAVYLMRDKYQRISPDIVRIPISDSPVVSTGILWSKKRHLKNEQANFIKFLVKEFADVH